SKKIAAGANGIVLDVKMGKGAFMPDLEQARALAETMVAIGHNVGRDMVALISDMNQPLGSAVGNALEVKEALETLHGGGPADFKAHCLEVAAYMLMLAGKAEGQWTMLDSAKATLEQALNDGRGLAKFREMVLAQG